MARISTSSTKDENQDEAQDVVTHWMHRAGNWRTRLVQITRVLMQFGLDSLLVGLERLIPPGIKQSIDPEAAELEAPARLRLALEELGPAAIKLGQTLATRSDLLPRAYIRELRKLQDDVLPISLDQIREVIREELKAEIEDLFEEFSEEPIASASLGQVHKAKLHGGQVVAVKVQRPAADHICRTDTEILQAAVEFAEKHNAWLRGKDISSQVTEFRTALLNELDYRIEAANNEHFRGTMKPLGYVKIPDVHEDYSTRRVLTLEWIEGVKPTDLEKLEDWGISRSKAAEQLGTMLAHQVIIDGFFHSDPHEGNVLFMRDGKLALLDCGYATVLSEKLRRYFIRIIWGWFQDDSQEVADLLLAMGIAGEEVDLTAFEHAIDRLMSRYGHLQRTSQVGVGEILEELMQLILSYNMSMPPAFPSLTKALLATEGVCIGLDNTFDYRPVAQKTLTSALYKELNIQTVAGELFRAGRDGLRYARLLPRQLSRVLGRLHSGTTGLHVTIEHLDVPLKRIDESVNRLSASLLVSAIIMSSALLAVLGQPDDPVAKFLIATYVFGGALLGLWLLVSAFRAGRF